MQESSQRCRPHLSGKGLSAPTAHVAARYYYDDIISHIASFLAVLLLETLYMFIFGNANRFAILYIL